MRLPIPAVLLVAACGADDGAVLTIHAPEGPSEAARLEIVLANADGATISTADQRVQRLGRGEIATRYYRQRAEGGAVLDVTFVDGFVVRIEREADVADEETFIPFVITYDLTDEVTGIGAVLDAAGDPMPVTIAKGTTAKYTVEMTPLSKADADAAIAPKQTASVACPSGQTFWRSGIAWQPAGQGPQLRLLLPDRSEDTIATDATARPADMDCDGHPADDDDCDDLRGEFHPSVAEACDGVDANCDGRTQYTQDCSLPANTCGAQPSTGVQLCVDLDGGHLSECRSDAQCACSAGNPGPCTKCVLDFRTPVAAGEVTPCAPAVGKLKIEGCDNGGCRVQTLGVTGPWKPLVSDRQAGTYGVQIDLPTAELFLRLKAEQSPIMAEPATSVGGVYLSVLKPTSMMPEILAVDVELTFQATDDCRDLGDGTGNVAMTCAP